MHVEGSVMEKKLKADITEFSNPLPTLAENKEDEVSGETADMQLIK